MQQALIPSGGYFIIYVNDVALEDMGFYRPNATDIVKVDLYQIVGKRTLRASFTSVASQDIKATKPSLQCMPISANPTNLVWASQDLTLLACKANFLPVALLGEGVGALLRQYFGSGNRMTKSHLNLVVANATQAYNCSESEIETALTYLAQMIYCSAELKSLVVTSVFDTLMQSFDDIYWGLSADVMLAIYNAVMQKSMTKAQFARVGPEFLHPLELEIGRKICFEPGAFDQVNKAVFLELIAQLPIATG